MKRKVAFTLAETMIVLVVLGVIATLTVPALISRQKESANRTKIKKAMSVYDTAINKMVIENGIRDNAALISTAGNADNNCAGSSTYFKISQGSGCEFKTSDGLWWNVEDITHPIVAFKQADLTAEKAAGDNKDAFYFVGRIDETTGILRVNDYISETEPNKGYLTKLYNFAKPEVGGGTDTNTAATNRPYMSCSNYGACIFYDMYGNAIGVGNKCPSNPTSISECTGYKSYNKIDENGRLLARGCNEARTSCNIYYKYDDNGYMISDYCEDEAGTDCAAYFKNDDSGRRIAAECMDEAATWCGSYYKYDARGNVVSTSCNEELTECYSYDKYDDSGNRIGIECDEAGTSCWRYYKYDTSGHKIAECTDAEYTNCSETFTITYTD